MGEAKNLAARRILAREKVQGIIRSHLGGDDAIFEMRHLDPVPRWVHHVVGELASVSVRDRTNQPAPVVARMKPDFRYAGEFLSNDVLVPLGVVAEFVKVYLLVEICIFRRALVTLGIS